MSNENDEVKETGFGNKVTEPNQRLMNRDGSSNVKRKGLSFLEELSFYHSLISMPWWKFNLLVFTGYLVVNLFFASLYFFIDIEHLNGMIAGNNFDRFLEAFFFSTQTITTVGFGRISPSGLADSTIAAFESMAGLLGFALATGLLYGKFSRPVAKILYSKMAVIAPYKNIKGFMIRIANKRKNELIEVEAMVIMSRVEMENGKEIRRFYTLELELKRVSILSMTWTIVHPIDENSPMFNMTPNDFKKKDVEWLVLIKCFEEAFSQTVHSRCSYKYDELIHNARFKPVVEPGPDGSVIVALDKINDVEFA
ncbi:MAG: ion channel [Bacteroidetes bacterium]|nr:ion channel [Bacteroidota bacterium]